jgi:hypothetical protein
MDLFFFFFFFFFLIFSSSISLSSLQADPLESQCTKSLEAAAQRLENSTKLLIDQSDLRALYPIALPNGSMEHRLAALKSLNHRLEAGHQLTAQADAELKKFWSLHGYPTNNGLSRRAKHEELERDIRQEKWRAAENRRQGNEAEAKRHETYIRNMEMSLELGREFDRLSEWIASKRD